MLPGSGPARDCVIKKSEPDRQRRAHRPPGRLLHPAAQYSRPDDLVNHARLPRIAHPTVPPPRPAGHDQPDAQPPAPARRGAPARATATGFSHTTRSPDRTRPAPAAPSAVRTSPPSPRRAGQARSAARTATTPACPSRPSAASSAQPKVASDGQHDRPVVRGQGVIDDLQQDLMYPSASPGLRSANWAVSCSNRDSKVPV